MAEQLAIMRGIDFGLRDAPYPVMWFEVKLDEASGALICLPWAEAKEVVSQVYSAKSLEGHACWVEVDDITVKFLRLAKL